MKKIIITLAIAFFGLVTFAQEEGTSNVVNKKGENILPQSGDFAIGVDATPFFNLIGNIIRINDGTGAFSDPSAFNFVDGTSIYGKYFLSNNAAVRARLNIHSMSTTFNNLVTDDANATDPNAKVTDTWKHSSSGIGLGLGYELRRGKGRLQGFYGGEVNFLIGGGSKDVYEYGNVLNNFDSIPTTTVDWGSFATAPVDSRMLDRKIAGGFGFGLRGFVGVEYFFFPNISLGGEFGWGFAYSSIGEGETNSENWNYTDHLRET